jgi:hypothetical protein
MFLITLNCVDTTSFAASAVAVPSASATDDINQNAIITAALVAADNDFCFSFIRLGISLRHLKVHLLINQLLITNPTITTSNTIASELLVQMVFGAPSASAVAAVSKVHKQAILHF